MCKFVLPLFGVAILFGRHLLMLQVATISTWVVVSALTGVVVRITVVAAALLHAMLLLLGVHGLLRRGRRVAIVAGRRR